MKKNYTRWITVDYDSYDHLRLSFHEFMDLVHSCKDVKIYKTKKGYHVLGYLWKKVSIENSLEIREYLGDDRKRIRHDMKHKFNPKGMFTEKRKINETINAKKKSNKYKDHL